MLRLYVMLYYHILL